MFRHCLGAWHKAAVLYELCARGKWWAIENWKQKMNLPIEDTTALDQFRVRQGLPLPICEMEPVECEPHQDTCVTISMQITHRFVWGGEWHSELFPIVLPVGGTSGMISLV